MKYNLTPLNLTGSFSIEMSVRGAALKRNNTNYYLLNTSNADYSLILFNNYPSI